MTTLLIFFILTVLALFGYLVFIFHYNTKDPFNTTYKYLMDWRFRKLKRLRGVYIQSLRNDPPTGYDFYKKSAERWLNKENENGKHNEDVQDICEMLSYPIFIDYYFDMQKEFSGILYHQMMEDYRSCVYSSQDYASISALREKLPKELSTNEGAFNDFIKFVNAGWFDKKTGMYIIGKDKPAKNCQYIGRAFYKICKRNNLAIGRMEKVFALLWNTEDSKIKGWHRNNENETITNQIDDIVIQIIKQ